MTILTPQAVPPTLKNHDFASAGDRFLKNQGLGCEDGLENALGFYRAPFASYWGSFGGSFETPKQPEVLPCIDHFCFGALVGRFFLHLPAEGLVSILEPSSAPFWCSSGPFGGCFGVGRTDVEL